MELGERDRGQSQTGFGGVLEVGAHMCEVDEGHFKDLCVCEAEVVLMIFFFAMGWEDVDEDGGAVGAQRRCAKEFCLVRCSGGGRLSSFQMRFGMLMPETVELRWLLSRLDEALELAGLRPKKSRGSPRVDWLA